MANLHILIVDDHEIVREGINLFLEDQHGLEVIAEAEHGKQALQLCEEEQVDFVIMDINMPVMNGIEATLVLKEEHPDIKVLALTMMEEDHHIRQMIEAGASGYITKSSGRDELLEAIETIMDGRHYFSSAATRSIMMDLVTSKKSGSKSAPAPDELTDREKEVLRLIVQEHTNQEIADKLYISVRTVDAHRRNLMQKTGSRNTAGLVRYALKHNLA